MNDNTNYIIFFAATALLITSNVIFLILYIKERKKPRPDSREVSDLMLDLLAGDALIKVTRISPTDVFLRSPTRPQAR